MRTLNQLLTNIDIWILKKLRWKNTEFNQRTISTILGWMVGFTFAMVFKFILT